MTFEPPSSLPAHFSCAAASTSLQTKSPGSRQCQSGWGKVTDDAPQLCGTCSRLGRLRGELSYIAWAARLNLKLRERAHTALSNETCRPTMI